MNNYIIVSDYEDSDDGVLYWSNEDGWGGRGTATVFTDAERGEVNLPLQAAGWVAVVVNERIVDPVELNDKLTALLAGYGWVADSDEDDDRLNDLTHTVVEAIDKLLNGEWN